MSKWELAVYFTQSQERKQIRKHRRGSMEMWYNLNIQGAQYPMSLNRNIAYSVKWHSRYSVYMLASELDSWYNIS
jgi:hypothetical protein